jgi:DNA-binding FrmR family transcriptional regulator
MVAGERDCVDILVRLTAVKSSLQSVAALVIQNYTSICLHEGENRDIGADLAHAISIWIGGRG